MSGPLDAAMKKLATMPAAEQERVGRWLLDEPADEEHWDRQFGGRRMPWRDWLTKHAPIVAPAAPRT